MWSKGDDVVVVEELKVLSVFAQLTIYSIHQGTGVLFL